MKPVLMSTQRSFRLATAWPRGLRNALLLLSAVAMGGCALEVENRQAAQQLAQESSPPGSVYLGWRVFQDKCAACHGVDGSGTVAAPDLLPLVRDMGAHRFVSLVLMRYDWNLPAGKEAPDSAARNTLIDDLVQRKETYTLSMLPWQQEPRVNAHIADLYAYISARAHGLQDPGRPAAPTPLATGIYRGQTPAEPPSR